MSRALAYVVEVGEITPIEGADRIELAHVRGWTVVIKKGEFKEGEKGVYFEVDSKVPENDERFAFLANRGYKIKTMKLNKFRVYSQGLLMPMREFPEFSSCAVDTDLTDKLGVIYAKAEDNARKAEFDNNAMYSSMEQRRAKLFKKRWAKWMMRRAWGRKVMFFFFGKKKVDNKKFPTQFKYIKKTDQERIENMTWVLKDETPFIKTEKCDGSSATFILERRPLKRFKFYVCSRNVRMLPDQLTFFGKSNPYWEMVVRYDIENKLRDYLSKHKNLKYVCWQGEICGPSIQGNPHHLSRRHLFLFHMIDSEKGFYDIREAKQIWNNYQMESVPIVDEFYLLPKDLEEFKISADGYYNSSVCEGDERCMREGYVYYKTTDPSFSFKNVSREYLMKKGE